jgi:hypothetical protein
VKLPAVLLLGVALLAACSSGSDQTNPPAPTTTITASVGATTPQVGFPRASNTGTTGTLARYTGPLNITAAGTVLQNVEVDGCLTLGPKANDVTIKNVLVRSNRCYWLILNDRGATGLHVTDTELDGSNSSTGDAAFAGSNFTLTRVNIHGTVDGGKLGNNDVIQDSYIHDLVVASGSHNDGLQSLGSVGVKIKHNSIVVPPGATSAIILSTNAADQIRNVDIDHNLLGGGAFTVYGGYELGTDDAAKVSGIRITDNEFTTTVYPKSGAFGPLTSTARPAVTVTGNTWADGPHKGRPVN